MRRQQVRIDSGHLLSIAACLQIIQDASRPKQSKMGILSCSDLSGYWKNWPKGINLEIPSSGEVGPDECRGLTGNQWLWLDLEDQLPLQPSIYSEIVAADWLEYCTWPRWALQKIYHLLQDSGTLWLLVRNRPTPFFQRIRREAREQRHRPHFKEDIEESPAFTDFHAFKKAMYPPISYRVKQIESMLKSLGFEIQQIQLFNDNGRSLHQWNPSRRQGVLTLIKKLMARWFLAKEKIWVLYVCKKMKPRWEWFLENISSHPVFPENFNRRYAEPIARLQQWISAYPSFRSDSVSALPCPAGRSTVLVLSPHPDDEAIGCGGLLLHLIESGNRVVVLQLTDGSICDSLLDKPVPYRHLVRIQEARQSAQTMGAECLCWGAADGNLQCSPEWIEKLHALLSDLRPNWIFAPFVNDPHPDHRACSDLLRAVLQRGFPGQEDLTIFSYEVSSFLPANVYFRIDRLIRRKEQWLLSYQNGLKSVDYVDFCLWRHAYASRIYTNQPGYIECFLVLRPEEYLSAEAFAEPSHTDP